MVFDPDAGDTWEECLSLGGNPAMDEDWPNYTLNYEDEDGTENAMELPMTFADFALTEGRFRKHFRMAPRDTWNENMVPMGEFIDLEEEDREGMYPFVWAVDKKNRLMRVICSSELVESTEERRDYWRTVKGLAGLLDQIDPDQIARDVRADMAQKLASGLFSMVSGGTAGADLSAMMAASPAVGSNAGASQDNRGAQPAAAGSADYESVWIDTPQCTACDECIEINPKLFAYNGDKKAVVLDPKAGSFKDIVRSAEKCTADCIHPGTPWNPNEKGLDKLIKRAEKYQ
jgi:pyruvate-ferredoxin/flavodoxin oxidoreductase